MSAPRIWGFERDPQMRAARDAGWRRRDLIWERLQERANRALAEGRRPAALRDFRRAAWLARAGFAARARGDVRRAVALYAHARALWAEVPAGIATLEVKPRARSSLFHLRMEARHRDTYRANITRRLAAFVAETDASLESLARGAPAPHRHHARWRGEKPAVFDDARKLLGACLLLATD